MARIAITESELLDALAAAAKGNGPADAKTAGELAEEHGISVGAARKALGVLKKQGRLVVHVVGREALDGRMARTSGYTILPAKKR